MTGPSLLISDVHLSPSGQRGPAPAVIELLRQHPGRELILVGDILDLSLLPPGTHLASGLAHGLTAHPDLMAALRRHVRGGGKLTWIPGNHDAGIEQPAPSRLLKELLACPDDRQLEVTPWFVRRGGVHIEHGHLYDRDCAPNHPLSAFDGTSEGLGTALMRRFVGPNDAHLFAHAHATTPLAGLLAAISRWRLHAPVVIGSYFHTAIALCAEAVTDQERFDRDRREGDARIEAHARRVGVCPDQLRRLLEEISPPTHQSLSDTFSRLYFDKVLAALSVTTGLALLGSAGLGLSGGFGSTVGTGALLSALGGSYLTVNLARKTPRYLGPVTSLENAARLVAETTKAELVIFGHTHVPVQKPGYVNLGSFGYGQQDRPYSVLDDAGRVERQTIQA